MSTPSSGPGPDPAQSPGASGQPGPADPARTGVPLRALTMVLVAAAIVFAGLGLMSLSGSGSDASAQPAAGSAQGAADSPAAAAPEGSVGASAASSSSTASAQSDDAAATDRAAPTSTAATTTAPASGENPATAGVAAASEPGAAADTARLQQIPVRVYNNSTVDGLAHDTAQTLTSDGWTVDKIANYEDGALPASAVYYGDEPDARAAAEAVGAQLGIPVKPRFDGISDASPGIIVILTAD